MNLNSKNKIVEKKSLKSLWDLTTFSIFEKNRFEVCFQLQKSGFLCFGLVSEIAYIYFSSIHILNFKIFVHSLKKCGIPHFTAKPLNKEVKKLKKSKSKQ